MTSENIRDLIFENNSTLFEVLDSLDVTNLLSLQTDVSEQQQLINQHKAQLDELARKEDNFEAHTTAEFVSVRSELEDLWQKLDLLDDEVAKINVEGIKEELNYFDKQLGELTELVQSIHLDEVNEQIKDLQQQTEAHKDVLMHLQDTTQRQSNEIKALQTRVNAGTRIPSGTTVVVKFLTSKVWCRGQITSPYGWLIAGGVMTGDMVSDITSLRGVLDMTFYLDQEGDVYAPYVVTLQTGIKYWFRWRKSNGGDYQYGSVVLIT